MSACVVKAGPEIVLCGYLPAVVLSGLAVTASIFSRAWADLATALVVAGIARPGWL